MFFLTKNSSVKAIFLSSVSRRLYRGLSVEANIAEKDQQENEEKKAKQQKYQELEKLEYRPLYLDAQATTPMVNFIDFKSISVEFLLINIGSTCS